jgi:hypothetical protein
MATSSRVNRPGYRLHSVLPTIAIIFFMLVAAPQAAAQSSGPDRADALSGEGRGLLELPVLSASRFTSHAAV